MLPAHPKLRDDLVTSRQDGHEGTSFVLKDPVTRRFFRLREAEYLIAKRLDGLKPLDALQYDLQRDLELELSVEALQEFVQQLHRLGLLHTEQSFSVEHRSLRHRVAGSPLYIRLNAFDPDPVFTRFDRKLGFFFTKGFIALSLAAVVLALGVTVSYWDEIVRDLGRLYRFDALLLAWITVLLVTAAHECAHGLTCKHFGGEVREIGFMLLYFQPAFYCNISDAWLFPKKSQRLWTTFAGAHFEIFVWSLATLTWRIVEPDTWVSFLAMVVMATSGIKTIFNLNPLIKLDGYYLLSDWLEVPNLRQRSIGFLKAAIKALWGSANEATTASFRERIIYVTYGVLAAIYSWWLLSSVALWFGSYLVERYQGAGFIAFSGLLMAVFRNPLSGAARSLPAPLRQWPVLFFQRIIQQRRKARVAVIVIALAFLCFGRLELRVGGEFTVLPVRNADVHAAVNGIIEHIHVKEGARVKAGDLLVQLRQSDYRAEFEQVEADITQKQAMLKMLRAGPRSEEIELTRDQVQTATTIHEQARKRLDEADRIRAMRLSKAEATVEAAEERLQYARTELERLTELFRQGLVAKKQLEEGRQETAVRESELQVAQAELAMVSNDTLAAIRQDIAVTEKEIHDARGTLTLLLAGSRPEVIEATEAEIGGLETRRRHLARQLDLTTVVSPVAGIVATPKLERKIGEHVTAGDVILKVLELETMTPEVLIPENEIADIAAGQKVVLKARAYPDRSFEGRVRAIAPAAEIEDGSLGRKVFRVTVAMDGGPDLLKPEMTGNAKILSGTKPIIYLMTRRFVRYLRVEFWSWW